MKPVNFEGSNVILQAPPGVTDVLPLPTRRTLLPSPEVVSCWELEPDELAEINRTGRVWLCIQGTTHAPLYVAGFRPFVLPGSEG